MVSTAAAQSGSATGGAEFSVVPPESPVKVTLTAWLVTTDAKGEDVYAPAETARPGDLIEYRVESVNESGKPLKGQVLNLPIPPGTTYVGGSASPAAVQASIDGGKTFAPVPLMREVAKPGGGTEKIQVPVTEYRALRWVVGIQAPGQRAHVKARIKVDGASGETP
ncbi:DUF11 domain-containing protein [Zavarzinia aquatilis]|nr:DUF11 domain-containing protein [Zavarzinia aquatilis]